MMPFRHAYLLLVLAAAAMLSCSKEETDVVDAGGREIVFGVDSIEFTVDGTKADVTTLSTLNVKCASGGWSEYWTEAWTITNATVSSGQISTGRYWPSSADYASLGLYHFAVANCDVDNLFVDSSSINVEVFASDGIDYVVGAEPCPTYGSPISIQCRHIFAKLGDVTFAPAVSGYSISNLTATLQNVGDWGWHDVTWNGWWVRSTDDWTVASNSGSFSSSYTSTLCKGNYLIPGTCTLSATYTVTRGSYTYTQSTPVSASVTFTNGVTSNLNITLPITEQSDPTFSVTVNPTAWTTGSTYSESM